MCGRAGLISASLIVRVCSHKTNVSMAMSPSISQPSVARFQVLALRPGFRDRRGRCVVSVRPPNRPASGTRRRCTGYLLLGLFGRRYGAGTNRFRLTGRLDGRALASGRYHLRAVPTFRSVSGAAVSAAFSITR